MEIRERPDLADKPVAVGGRSGRGVLTTCNYIAREFGCRSAMPGFKARRLCPDLVVLPVRFDLYRAESAKVREVFAQFTDKIEPLSLDEAFLDVSHLQSSAEAIAWEVRSRIWENQQLTASAGIAPNKFLAKIASDWNKPNGQFAIREEEIADFIIDLPVEKIWGVGKRTAEKLHAMGAKTCGDLQSYSELQLSQRFGKFGRTLYRLSRGIDSRPVNPNRERKSVSNERTFSTNLRFPEEGVEKLRELVEEVIEDLQGKHSQRQVRECFVKLKFEDFQTTTAQRASARMDGALCEELLHEGWERGDGKSVRLIGAGVRFHKEEDSLQPELFDMGEER
ncbi:MAG: DNA polymerase IV [Verrucomicrobiota bacterium]